MNYLSRRSFLAALGSTAAAWLSGCDASHSERAASASARPQDHPRTSRIERIDRSLHVSPAAHDIQAGCRKGAAYLAKMAQADGTIDAGPHGLSYPVYTAALAV